MACSQSEITMTTSERENPLFKKALFKKAKKLFKNQIQTASSATAHFAVKATSECSFHDFAFQCHTTVKQ